MLQANQWLFQMMEVLRHYFRHSWHCIQFVALVLWAEWATRSDWWSLELATCRAMAPSRRSERVESIKPGRGSESASL